MNAIKDEQIMYLTVDTVAKIFVVFRAADGRQLGHIYPVGQCPPLPQIGHKVHHQHIGGVVVAVNHYLNPMDGEVTIEIDLE